MHEARQLVGRGAATSEEFLQAEELEGLCLYESGPWVSSAASSIHG